jgi:hypothetical protein
MKNDRLATFFTSTAILCLFGGRRRFSAKAVAHIAPSSRFASCMKRNVSQEKGTQLD